MSSLKRPSNGPAYWKSLEHVTETSEFREFLHREFPAGASELLDGDRRHFVKIMGASMALAGLGLGGCRRWPEEHIAPYAARPEGRDPGTPMFYATCLERGGVASPLLAKAYDGRPIKIEGNPDHAASMGAADVFAQASVLDLYDPDRSRDVRHSNVVSSWEDFATAAASFDAGSLAILSEATSSPSSAALRAELEQAGATWFEYESINNDAVVAASTGAFGAPHRTVLSPADADVILTFDADLLERHPDAMRLTRGFADGRRRMDEGRMNRLYCIESGLSLTGANADERAAVAPADLALAAAYVASRVLGGNDFAALESAGALPAGVQVILDHAIDDLQSNPRRGLVVAGDQAPVAVQWIAHLLNTKLENVGHTVAYSEQPDATAHVASLRALVTALQAGQVQTLLIIGGNPVYDAPADLGFAAAMSKAATTIHLAEYVDETSSAANWHLNRAHYLEAWGDSRTWDGSVSIAQPLVEPLFDGRSPVEVLALVAGRAATDGQSIVRATAGDLGANTDGAWRSALHNGMVSGTAATAKSMRAGSNGLAAAVTDAVAAHSAAGTGWQVSFAPSTSLYDGRFANNGWLQELPDAMTKLTWDNAVIMNPVEAEALGVKEGDTVRLKVGGQSVTAGVFRLPGVAAKTAILELGQGRTLKSSDGEPGRICTDAGLNFGMLRAANAMWMAAASSLIAGDGEYPLAVTQDHHTIETTSTGGRGVQERLPQLFREADANAYREHKDFAKHGSHVVHRLSLWDETNLTGTYRWGMSVDLNTCTGCNACVIACQAENNIPVVGKDQVIRGRELHWMRIDRYFRFAGNDHDGWDATALEAVAVQPMMCQMCETAPCEQVCPVAATTHDMDGLNVMVYNRCIGTRYCSNNCPYKVRRFNYFDYHNREPHRTRGMMHVDTEYYTKRSGTPAITQTLQFNPEVTVRMRGVMEKCTYCVQNIIAARVKAKNDWVANGGSSNGDERIAIADGSVTTACAQTCPAKAIVFGDLADDDSRVSHAQRDSRSYEVLGELNVKARTQYLARIRNPHGGGSAENPYPSHGGGGGHDSSPEAGDGAGHAATPDTGDDNNHAGGAADQEH